MNDVKRIIIVLLGTIIILLLCFFAKSHADVEGWKIAYKYNIAITANKKDEFNYDVDSHQGLVLSHGEFSTKKGVKFDEMNKTFTYVKRVQQHYTMHTYTTCSGKPTHCTTHTYYSWDDISSETVETNAITYMSRDYSPSLFDLGNFVGSISACAVTKPDTSGFFGTKHGCRSGWGGDHYYIDNDDRYYYLGVPLKFTASFITNTSDGTLKYPFGSSITLETKSIAQMKKDSTSYKFYHNLFMTIGSAVIVIVMAVLGYMWIMADGEWSLER